MKDSLPTAFISASPTVDTAVIRQLLRGLGVDPQDAFDLEIGAPVADVVRSRIQKSVFVVAMLDRPSPGVWYELGMAQALRKPILLLSQPDVDLPLALQGDVRLRSSKFDDDVVRLAVRKFASDVLSGKKLRIPPMVRQSEAVLKRTRARNPTTQHEGESFIHQEWAPNRSRAGELIAEREIARIARELSESRSDITETQAAHLTAAMFKAAGVDAIPNDLAQRDRGADFAVWSAALDHSIGNPVLIDIKVGTIDQARLRDAEQRVRVQLDRARLRVALLLYLDRQGRRIPAEWSDNPFIFRYDLEDFARALTTRSFDSILLEQRNRIVHGVRG